MSDNLGINEKIPGNHNNISCVYMAKEILSVENVVLVIVFMDEIPIDAKNVEQDIVNMIKELTNVLSAERVVVNIIK